MPNPPVTDRPTRKQWNDRWLLEAFRERGKELTNSAGSADSAWEALEESGVKSADIVKLVSDLSSMEPVDVSGVGPKNAALLTRVLSDRYDVIAVSVEGRRLVAATANPLRQNLDRDLAFASGRAVKLCFAHPAAIRAARARIFGGVAVSTEASRLAWLIPKNVAGGVVQHAHGAASDALDRIIVDAMDQRASDIHLEPKEGELLVRYRVDGVLHDVTRISADITPLLLSRLKVGAGLDIANRRKPQDGRASLLFDGRPVDLRISTLPLGERIEKAVVRVLDATATALNFDSLGFTQFEAEALRRILGNNEGMVLVTGPTGSGKTTTLYSALLHLASPETNIVTVEDPIEYRLPGINQVQVEEKQGLTFASALRSILRQDPDVVLVGEIRDTETAEIAVRAAMTGHLVLSTLHTNDAVSAMTRLADIGVDLGNLATALRAVLAQRLVRRLCLECSQPASLHEVRTELRWLLDGKDMHRMRRAVGCPACRGTGFRGRLAVAELLVIDEESRQLMATSNDRQAMLQFAHRSGMQPLWEAGMHRVLSGETSIEELAATVTPPIPAAAMQQGDVDALLKSLLAGNAAPVAPVVPVVAAAIADEALAPQRRPSVASSGRASSGLVIAPRQQALGDRVRVLIVHEELQYRRALRLALEAHGCIVLEAADGESALTFASCLRPDAVVTEVVLPKLNGVGLAQALLAEAIVDHVFVCTDQRDELMLQWVTGTGVTDVIAAVDDPDRIAERIMRQLRPRKLTDSGQAS